MYTFVIPISSENNFVKTEENIPISKKKTRNSKLAKKKKVIKTKTRKKDSKENKLKEKKQDKNENIDIDQTIDSKESGINESEEKTGWWS